jgi:hypothetical protein
MNVTNPTIMLAVSIAGQHVGGSDSSPESLTSTLTRTIKVGTTIVLSSVISHAPSGAGPVPPTAGIQTTYTVALTARNTVNSVGAAKVTMQLPSYVTYTNAADAGVTYDTNSRTVTWTVGDLSPNASASAKFQISFLPSSSQTGISPVLVGQETFTGVDRFTSSAVSALAPELTSDLQGVRGSGTVH